MRSLVAKRQKVTKMNDTIYSDMYDTWVEVPVGYWEGEYFIITGYKRVKI